MVCPLPSNWQRHSPKPLIRSSSRKDFAIGSVFFRAASARKKTEPIAKSFRELLRIKGFGLCRCQFEGKGHTIKPLADLCHELSLAVGQFEPADRLGNAGD